ncbi:MAG: nucleotidyltransferase family protein [Acidobacteriota bacterium]
MIPGLILAAGQSSRMGRPKAGLAIADGGPTFAAAIVATLRAAGVGEVVIVAGAHPAEVADSVRGLPGVRVVQNPRWPAGQLSSLLAGLDAVDTPELEAVLVTLVDVPLVRPATVMALLEAWRGSRAPIVRPAIGERHGHPVIFDRVTFSDLRAAPLEVGAKAVVGLWHARILNVPTADRGVLIDVDTPQDYGALRGADAS